MNPKCRSRFGLVKAEIDKCIGKTSLPIVSGKLDEHEKAVMNAFCLLLIEDRNNFNVTDLTGSTVAEFEKIAKTHEGLLTWVLLLHDIGKHSSAPIQEPHAEVSALFAEKLQDSLPDEKDLAAALWLIELHDALGNIFTSERSWACLLDGLLHCRPQEQRRRLDCLVVVTACDVWGSGKNKGHFVTEEKARFWLTMCRDPGNFERSFEKLTDADDLLQWRLYRWLFCIRLEKVKIHRHLLEYIDCAVVSRMRPQTVDIFRDRITLIIYGNYLLQKLTESELVRLMEKVADVVASEPGLVGREFRLEFVQHYSPHKVGYDLPKCKEAVEVLKEYRDSIKSTTPLNYQIHNTNPSKLTLRLFSHKKHLRNARDIS